MTPTSEDDTANNPFVCRLPNPTDDDALIKLVARDPFRDRHDQVTENYVRQLPNLLQTVVVPTPGLLHVARTLFDVLHNGYARRDPRYPSYWTKLYQREEGVTYADIGPSLTDAVAISGITGLGKSHQVRSILGSIPQTIHHEKLMSGQQGESQVGLQGITQIVWIYMDMSTASNLTAWMLDLLGIIDRLLGHHEYQGQFEKARVNIEMLINKVIQVLTTHSCGMLVLDEIQRSNFGLKAGAERVRNLMLKLLNAGIPVVLVGNPLGLQFNEKEGISAQLTRRLKSNRPIRLDPADSAQDPDWQVLVRGLWRCQILPERDPWTMAHCELLYQLTGGFPKFLSELLVHCQQQAWRAGARKLTLEMIAESARTCEMLISMQKLIKAFVFRDLVSLRVYSDVDREYYQQKWQNGPIRDVAIQGHSVSAAMTAAKSQQEVLAIAQGRAKAQLARQGKDSNIDEDASKLQSDLLKDQIDAMVKKGLKD